MLIGSQGPVPPIVVKSVFWGLEHMERRWLKKVRTFDFEFDIMTKTLDESKMFSFEYIWKLQKAKGKSFVVDKLPNSLRSDNAFQRYCLKSNENFASFIQNLKICRIKHFLSHAFALKHIIHILLISYEIPIPVSSKISLSSDN